MTFVEIETDCWITPPNVCSFVEAFWGRPTWDPFCDPAQIMKAEYKMSIRDGLDAYTSGWEQAVGDGETVWLNGPYSRKNPERTAKLAARIRARGAQVLNLTPASLASSYWRRYVWTLSPVVAHLGRLPFVIGRGENAGELAKANRADVALVYLGDARERFTRLARELLDAVVLCPAP